VSVPRPPRRSRAKMIATTRARLIAAARMAFGRSGYADAVMDDITASAGLTRGALYHHFGGKDGLLEAVVDQIGAEMDARLEAAYHAAPDPWTGFRTCTAAYLRMALEPEIQRIVLRDAPAVLGERFRALDEDASLFSIVTTLETLMERGVVARTDPEALARMVNGALVDAALWIARAPDPRPRLDAALGALDTMLDGLRRTPVNDASGSPAPGP
jgi:AcrR family transcriptional regulator